MSETFGLISGISQNKTPADKVFSQEKWLEAAKNQLEQGYITEDEIQDAYDTWVKDLAGKKYSDIDEIERSVLKEEWFV